MESEEVEHIEGEAGNQEEGEDTEVLDVPESSIHNEDNFESGNVLHLQVRGKYYKQTYRSAWEQMPDFKGWLRGVQGEPTRAYCTYCQKTLHAHRLSLLKHTCTIRHQKAAQLHNSRKIKKLMSESELSSSEDEGAKVNDKQDPDFSISLHKGKRGGKASLSPIKTEPRQRKRSFKNSDFEYEYDDDPVGSPNSSVDYKLPKSIIELRKKKGLISEKSTPKYNKTMPSQKNKKNKNSSYTVKDEVSDAIKELQSLSDSIQVKEEDEFDIFGKYIASQLKQLSVVKAIRAKSRIYSFLSDLRLAEIHESSSNQPPQGTTPVAYISIPTTVAAGLSSTSSVTVSNNVPSTSAHN